MTISLAFSVNRETIRFLIEGKKVIYYDRKWQNGIQMVPKDSAIIKKLITCRNSIPFSKMIIQWIEEANTGENLKEYSSAKDEQELSWIVRRDAKSKGLIEITSDYNRRE